MCRNCKFQSGPNNYLVVSESCEPGDILYYGDGEDEYKISGRPQNVKIVQYFKTRLV